MNDQTLLLTFLRQHRTNANAAEVDALVRGVEGMAWQPIGTRPGPLEAPCRQFILIDGHKWHSGARWARRFHGEACVDGTTSHGYRETDIRRILADGDIDADGWTITHWMPACYPVWPPPPPHGSEGA